MSIKQPATIFWIVYWAIYLAAYNNIVSCYTLLKTDDIWGNFVLKQINGPYLAADDVIIRRGVNLTIEPGTELRFAKGRELHVMGTLVARGNATHRIRFTKLTEEDANLLAGFNTSAFITPYPTTSFYDQNNRNYLAHENSFRLVEGESIFDGKLQIFYNSKWHYVCSTQFNWTEVDVNVTCKSLGFNNGTFYYYAPSNNLTSHMKMFMPRCHGKENSLFDCPGTANPELGLTVCDNQNVVGILCEGFDNQAVLNYHNWGGIVFEKYAPYVKTQEHTSVFYNLSKSALEYVDVEYAGLSMNRHKRIRPLYDYVPSSAITVFQYAPRFHHLIVENSIGNGLNYSNIEAPAFLSNSIFRYNRGHGIVVKTRFGNVHVTNTVSHDNKGDGLKYMFNNTIWSKLEQDEYFTTRYLDYCDAQNPLSYPAYYKFRNPNYIKECSKTFSTDPELRITLHFQKTQIVSKYSTYWLEVYDGHTDKNPLIANYTFENGKTPESIFSRSNYLFVKLRFQCNYPTDRRLQPVELGRLGFKKDWDVFNSQRYLYENQLLRNNQPPIREDLYVNERAERPWQQMPFHNVPPLFLSQLEPKDRANEQLKYERIQKEENIRFQNEVDQKNAELSQTQIACPYSAYDEITMYAMVGVLKNPDLLVKNSHFVNNSLNGVNATNLHSLIQFNETVLASNRMNGLHVQAGAGDVSFYHSHVSDNAMNGVNITYAGGLKEFNYTRVQNNGLYGIYVDFNVTQEFDNIYQNTTLNGSVIEMNALGGVFIGSYCNYSNITINGTAFRLNREDGLVIESCRSEEGVDWYEIDMFYRFMPKFDRRTLKRNFKFLHLNISWNLFDSNRLNGVKISSIQNIIGIMTNNTFTGHRKGALLITPGDMRVADNLIRNVSLNITYNLFYNNSGRYALNVGLNPQADRRIQNINITFNRFEHNTMTDPYQHRLNARTGVSAVAIVSSSGIGINQNWFNNPRSKLQIATQLENYTARINASFNWFNQLKPVYDLHYFLSYRDRCNQQWLLVRESIFDISNRSNLAQVVFWPFACNERLWFHESSIDLKPPADFDMRTIDNLGGVFDSHDATLPSSRYTVVNDIFIKPGAKLTIRPGTELNFLNGVGMLVLGELNVEGHMSSQVKFTLLHNHLNYGGVGVYTSNNFDQFPYAGSPSAIRSNSNTTIALQTNTTITNSTTNETMTTTRPPLPEPIIQPSYMVSLVDGRTPYEGRLKVEINSVSGTVCARGWSLTNSRIVCAQLGLVLDPSMHIYSRWLGDSDTRRLEPIMMSEVQCDPLDTSIFECRHTRRTDHTCTHQDDVWIRCLRPGWAGVRFGMSAERSRIKYAMFEGAGQYDYAKSQLAPALQFDLMHHHELSNLTFQGNEFTSMEVVFSQPDNKKPIHSLNFVGNRGPGLVTRSAFLQFHQIYAQNNEIHPAVDYHPLYTRELLSSVRLYAAEPRRSYDVRRELTRLQDMQWFIGAEERVLLYTDTEYNFGEMEYNVQISTDNNRVLVVDVLDYNPNPDDERVVLCERLCQQSFKDPNSREWNLSDPGSLIYFPVNTSYSVLHISYNVSSYKSGRLALLIYSRKAPEPVYDYTNPSYVYMRNLMPENLLKIHNSTFIKNRHSIVMRQYEDNLDRFGNIRRRFNYSNIIISNCTFHSNEQVFWLNTDPPLPFLNQRVNNLTIHVANSLFESNKDDLLIREYGYEVFDLIPREKFGPLGRVNVTFEECIFLYNYGGIRSLYRYYEYSNTLWHFEIRNNRFVENKQSVIKLLLPRVSRFAMKNDWENYTHSVNLRNNEFAGNQLFGITIEGYYAQINITKNLFFDNHCRLGLIRFGGTKKDFFIYSNQIERNEGNYIFDLDARSHADNDYDLISLLVENAIRNNKRPSSAHWRENQQHYSTMREAAGLLIPNAPTAYAIALRGIQNCSINKNILENVGENGLDYELVGAMSTNTLNSSIDATQNWWGTTNPNVIKDRIFDLHEWNNHALVAFVPFIANLLDFSLSIAKPIFSIHQQNEFTLGGIISEDVTLTPTPIPYQVRSDLTIMPGASLYISPGVELEFYPNVGILVLGDLKASGTQDNYIKMRPIRKSANRMPLYSTSSNFPATEINANTLSPAMDGGYLHEAPYINYKFMQSDSDYLNTSRRLRLFEGLSYGEGFLQIYNASLRSWTMVCDEQFNWVTARVVCRQMGLEYRNVLVRNSFFYINPYVLQPIWNQTFICFGGEKSLSECDTFANFRIDECRAKNHYTYIKCNPYTLDKEGYEAPWGGIRFAQPYFESYSQQSDSMPASPFILKPDLQPQMQDSSYMYYTEIFGAGRLHNEPSPAVQAVHRTPLISNCAVKQSTWHGMEFLQSRTTVVLNRLRVEMSDGYAINSVQMNVQSTDQKSSYRVLNKNTLSTENIFSMVDMCDPHKYYDLDQRVIIYYRYSNLPRDCVKIFRTRLSTTNLGGSNYIGLRFLQFQLVNNTVLNDTVEIYNGTIFKRDYLMKSLSNESQPDDLEQFYLSRTSSLSVFIKAGAGAEFFGFIAEVLIYPTAQYLLTDAYIEMSDSELNGNQLGAVLFASAGERNPHLFIVRNRMISNGLELFNQSSWPACDITLQNSPKFYFGNNYVANNFGGVTLNLHSGSGVLITSTVVYNNMFYGNRNDTILNTRGPLLLPYNEMGIDKNLFLENEVPRSDLIFVSGLLSKFTRNQIVYNKAARILFTQGFENVSTPRHQDISFNLIRDNFAYGIFNELEDANRFRSTMVAASLKQIYYANYLFNENNDFELTALTDPMSLAYLASIATTTPLPPFLPKDYKPRDRFFDTYDWGWMNDDPSYERTFTTTRGYEWNKIAGLFAQNAVINASYNYWGTIVDTEVRARIRDKYDNGTLFEVSYSPAVDKYKLRDGKCELGWTLIDDTCYTYVGSYVTYREAELICKRFEGRLARETVAPIKLPRFRKLARTSQFEYETQSYRKTWLHSDALIGLDLSLIGVKCSVVDDYGVDSVLCTERLPFICEKDPIFLGATFRFKDEIAFAIAAIAALIVCIVLLCLLWLYKSRRRKKEHIDRQNTLRSSARTHRHMIMGASGANLSASQFSTLNTSSSQHVNKSGAFLYNQHNTSMDSLSARGLGPSGSSSALMNRSGRSLYGQIYNSQRNQYFKNKSRNNTAELAEEERNNQSVESEVKTQPPTIFISSGLDSNANFYGESSSSDDAMTNTKPGNTALSIQYHMLDAATSINITSTNRSALHHHRAPPSPLTGDEESQSPGSDDPTNTTNTTESDDMAATNTMSRRFQQHQPSPNSNKTTMTTSYADSGLGPSEATVGGGGGSMLEKQFIHTRLIKTSADTAAQQIPKQSTPNLAPNNAGNRFGRAKNFVPFTSSYDKLMNTTITTDTDDDQDGNSKRLLTNKVNTSNFDTFSRKPQPPPPQQHQLASSFRPSTFDRAPSRNDLQSGSILSNATTTNMTSVTPLGNVSLINPSHAGVGGSVASVGGVQYSSSDYENLSNSALNDLLEQQYSKSSSSRGPPLVADRKLQQTRIGAPPPPPPPPTRPPPIYNPDDDDESLMSCQLITSASLLVNRDLVKEARHVTANSNVAHQPVNKSAPVLNPRGIPPPPTNTQQTTPHSERRQNAVVQVQTDAEVITKPPPMETAI